jgi:cardiolipin synthase
MIPNLLSLLRIALTPYALWAVSCQRYVLLGIILLVAGLSDFLDGYTARKLNMESSFGQLLDPICDKVFVVGVTLAYTSHNLMPLWLCTCIVVRDICIVLGGVWIFITNKKVDMSPHISSKLNTAFIFALLLWVPCSKIFLIPWGNRIDVILHIVIAYTLFHSGFFYAKRFFQNHQT